MIKIGKKETYFFDGIHIPRIYINNLDKVRSSLEILNQNGILSYKEMTEKTERVRSEDIREIFYLLWKLGFGIEVSQRGRELVFIANDKLGSIIEMKDNELKNLILSSLKIYNPFVAVLDILIEYRDKSFTTIKKLFNIN